MSRLSWWKVIGLVLTLGSAVSQVSPAEELPDPLTLMRRAIEAEGQVALAAVEVVEEYPPPFPTPLNEGPPPSPPPQAGRPRGPRPPRPAPRITRRRVLRQGPRLRIEYISPESVRGYLIVDDGQRHFEFDPRERTVWERPSRSPEEVKQDKLRLLRRLQENFEVRVLREDTVAGRPAIVVEMRPKRRRWGFRFGLRLWLDRERGIRLRREELAPKGRIRRAVYFTRLRFDPPLSPERFQFVPPPGVKVEPGGLIRVRSIAEAQRHVPFKILEPRSLPPGFHLKDVAISPRMGPPYISRRVTLAYTDGANMFTLSECQIKGLKPRWPNPHRPHPPRRPHRLREGLYVWMVGDVVLALVGRTLPDEQLRQIVASLPPSDHPVPPPPPTAPE